MTLCDKITFYTNVILENTPEEAHLALYNMLVTEIHRFKLDKFIVEDLPY